MSISLYDASVASYLQVLPAVSALLSKAEEHFTAQGVALDELMDIRLHPDMLPMRFQIHSVIHHSAGAIEGIKVGTFSPSGYDANLNFADAKAGLEHAHKQLAAMTAEEVNALSGQHVDFVMGDLRLPFVAETFVLSFSLPNFHFHAATAYDIFRSKGLPLGKKDFLGRLRIIRRSQA